MSNTNSTLNANTNETLNPTLNAQAEGLNAPEQEKSAKQIFDETLEDWGKNFEHLADLVALCAQGEALTDARKGFILKSAKVAPHAYLYVRGLLAGFASPKAGRFLKETPVCEQAKRVEIAIAILKATKLGGTTDESCKKWLAESKKKQEKIFALAVASRLA